MFVKRSAAISSAATPLGNDSIDASSSEDPTVPPSIRRRFDSDWVKGQV